MSMLTWYLVALVVGGTLVAVSLIFGGDGDHDHDVDHDFDIDADMDMDADVEAEVEADADADHEMDHGVSGLDALQGWLPIASMRFWTFFLAFFGLTGTVVTAGSLLGGIATPILATAVGYVCGASITNSIRRLRKQVVDSSLGEKDYVGATAKVVLPVSKGKTGKIRMTIKGRVVELMAQTDDDVDLGLNQAVMVYALRDDGTAVVSRTEQLPE